MNSGKDKTYTSLDYMEIAEGVIRYVALIIKLTMAIVLHLKLI